MERTHHERCTLRCSSSGGPETDIEDRSPASTGADDPAAQDSGSWSEPYVSLLNCEPRNILDFE